MEERFIDRETFVPWAAEEARKRGGWDPFQKSLREMGIRAHIFDREETVDAYKDWPLRLVEYLQDIPDPQRFSELVRERVREEGEAAASFTGLLRVFEEAQMEIFEGRGEELLSGALATVRAETVTEKDKEKGYDLLNNLLNTIERLPTREELLELTETVVDNLELIRAIESRESVELS